MATTSLVQALITEDGEALQIIFSFDAVKVVDAQTTISFLSAGDEMQLTVSDSANGLSAFTVGDQVEITGAGNAANNFFWEVTAATSGAIVLRVRSDRAQEGMTQDRDGVTEAAGAAVTISIVPDETDATLGTITLGGDASSVATLQTAGIRNHNHTVYVYANAAIDTPIEWGMDVDMTATLNAAWVLRNGQGNTALSSVSVVNRSQRKSAADPAGYDNWKFCDGVSDAPDHVGTALDPLDDTNLSEWWAPDLEAHAQGDEVTTLINQINGGVVSTSNSSGFYRYEKNTFKNGMAGYSTVPSATWRSRFLAASSTIGGDHTIIMVGKANTSRLQTSSTIAYNTNGMVAVSGNAINGDAGGLSTPFPASNVAGASVHVLRRTVANEVSVWANYTKSIINDPGHNGFIFGRVGVVAQVESTLGRVFYIAGAPDDATIERYVRYLLNQYQSPWAPSIYVHSTGSDSTGDGTLASPVKTLIHAARMSSFKSSPHILLSDGDDIDLGGDDLLEFSASAGGSNKESQKSEQGFSPKYPSVIRTVRATSQEPVCHFRNVDSVVRQSISNGTCSGNAIIYGVSVRDAPKIPTNSVLRIAGDAAFNASPTATKAFVTLVDDADSLPGALSNGVVYAETNQLCLINCHGVGVRSFNYQTSVLGGHLSVVSTIDCSFTHAWGTGHSIVSFIASTGCVYQKNTILPTPGHEPIDSIEEADYYSRGIYDQYSGPGCHIVAGLLSALDASSPIQMRSGGWVANTAIIDGSSGWTGTFCDTKFSRIIQEGGFRLSSAQPINWGAGGNSPVVARYDQILFLPERTYAENAYGISLNNDPDLIKGNGTIGAGPANQWAALGEDWRRVELTNITWADRSETIIDLDTCKNVTMDNFLVRTAYDIVDIPNQNDAYVTAGNYTFTNNILDQSAGAVAKISGSTKTLAQLEAIVSTANGNAEEAVTFFDDTRSFRDYSRTKLDDETAEVEDLAYEMIRQRLNGDYDEELQFDYIFDWVWDGFYSTSHPGKGAVMSAPETTSPPAGRTLRIRARNIRNINRVR